MEITHIEMTVSIGVISADQVIDVNKDIEAAMHDHLDHVVRVWQNNEDEDNVLVCLACLVLKSLDGVYAIMGSEKPTDIPTLAAGELYCLTIFPLLRSSKEGNSWEQTLWPELQTDPAWVYGFQAGEKFITDRTEDMRFEALVMRGRAQGVSEGYIAVIPFKREYEGTKPICGKKKVIPSAALRRALMQQESPSKPKMRITGFPGQAPRMGHRGH